MKTLTLILVTIFFSGCAFSQLKKSETKSQSKYDFGKCHDDRKTEKTIENVMGKIIKINDALWALQPEGESTRYGLCQIPEELKKDGMMVTFSGEIKKIQPNERMAAKPFKVTAFSIVKK